MAEFITTQGASYQIERIIKGAKQFVFLISPYLKFSKTFFERLELADSKGIAITIVYGKTDLSNSEENRLNKLKNLKIYYCHELHAKCYFNEEQMVITSMNLYEYSQVNNREMGIAIRKSEDRTLYEDAFEETQAIIRISEPQHEEEVEDVALEVSSSLQESELLLDESTFWQMYSQKIYNKMKGGLEDKISLAKEEYDEYPICKVNDYPFAGTEWHIHKRMGVSFKDRAQLLFSREHRPAIREKFPDYKISWRYRSINIDFHNYREVERSDVNLERIANSSVLLFEYINQILSHYLEVESEAKHELTTTKGYCLRCQSSISFNPERPYCYDCYKSWVQYENYDYTEKHCHRCGKEYETSMNYPQCGDCYSGKKDSSFKKFEFQKSDKALIYFENGEYSFRQSVPHSMYRILVNKFGTERIFEIHQNAFKYSFAFSMNQYPIKGIIWNFHENAYLTIEFEDMQELKDFEVHQSEMVSMFPNYSMNWGKYQINIRRTLGDIDRTEELLHEVVQTQLKMFNQFNEMLLSRIERPL